MYLQLCLLLWSPWPTTKKGERAAWAPMCVTPPAMCAGPSPAPTNPRSWSLLLVRSQGRPSSFYSYIPCTNLDIHHCFGRELTSRVNIKCLIGMFVGRFGGHRRLASYAYLFMFVWLLDLFFLKRRRKIKEFLLKKSFWSNFILAKHSGSSAFWT